MRYDPFLGGGVGLNGIKGGKYVENVGGWFHPSVCTGLRPVESGHEGRTAQKNDVQRCEDNLLLSYGYHSHITPYQALHATLPTSCIAQHASLPIDSGYIASLVRLVHCPLERTFTVPLRILPHYTATPLISSKIQPPRSPHCGAYKLDRLLAVASGASASSLWLKVSACTPH